MKKVKVNIGDLLEKQDLSLRALADKCGIRHAALSELINGKRQNINFGHIERIANTLDIEDINEIISLIEVKGDNDAI
ncbi:MULTISPECIES: helix-turn-helix domain-containing protein [Bacillus]|uniref:helix-turn-helix domain-containing protein n=1 Tax=Bacillus TaxID=1386 RepID=UPI000288B4A0|nr:MULTISPECIES: helix-turn-helix transcriptional regulator [Bacillus]MCY8797787.1 helix-turn-helix transcriptional regulator [Bacillus inaquosorum]MCY9034723.1 helix-turn-helix transcriptional regulator [Bacillus inaquosorum]MDI6565586.1 helix-turn-helix transcriptional regulator [Bacillus subtilis]MEC0769207.1 helix-turn-helix transcriptional regulator [Bacillus inaquosorum]MEC0794831.1 helix-turn-helix transcriptional regulator [Bacillus inaquosorum]